MTLDIDINDSRMLIFCNKLHNTKFANDGRTNDKRIFGIQY